MTGTAVAQLHPPRTVAQVHRATTAHPHPAAQAGRQHPGLSRNAHAGPPNAAFDSCYRPIQHRPGNGQRSESADLSKFREGTGKTVAIRSAVADLDPSGHTVIYIGNPATGVRGILAHVVTALGGRPVHGTAALAVQAWSVLAGEAAERGRTPVLIIDEAHMLDHDQLESIRMMTNHDMDSSTPFATILVGQPTLRHSVKLGVLAALEQRITVRYQMKGMTPDETASYVRHHLEQAGRTAELFTDDAVAQIHQAARGKPRTVNNICTAALIAAAGAGKNLVDHASARAAIAEVTATD